MSRLARCLTQTLVLLSLCLAAPITWANLGDTDDSATDDPGFMEGKAAIESGDWDRAISALSQTAETYPESADTQNFLGYAYRQSGDLDAAFRHYQLALEIDPSHKPTHEYLGEAYLMKDDLDGAEQHLAELERLCSPIPCEEYKELKRAVDAYRAR